MSNLKANVEKVKNYMMHEFMDSKSYSKEHGPEEMEMLCTILTVFDQFAELEDKVNELENKIKTMNKIKEES